MKKVKLKVLIPFHDMENNGKKRVKNEEFECTEKRALELFEKLPENYIKILSIKNNKK